MAKNGKRKKAKETAFKFGGIFYKIARTVAAPVAFVEQISEKHRAILGTNFSEADLGVKAKIMLNIITGSATGVNFFKDEYQAPLSQFKIANIVNKWTKTGAVMIGYEYVATKFNESLGKSKIRLPQGSKIGTIGRSILVGGAVGGILDAKLESTSTRTGTAHLSPQLDTRMIYANGSSGTDSTESGL